MNINITSYRNVDSSKHDTTDPTLRGLKVLGPENTAEIKLFTDKIKKLSGFSPISKEALNLHRLEERSSRESSRTYDRSEYKLTDSNGNTITVVQPERTITYSSDKYRLIDDAYQLNTPGNASGLSFSSLANGYDEISEELKSQYTGEELEKKLERLDKDYKDVLDYIADSTERSVSYAASKRGEKGALSAIEEIFGKSMSEMNAILDKIGLDKNKPIVDNIEAIVKYLDQRKDKSAE